ncbi:hypothetical protein OIO90_002804 [Microbotryomycetes sp. JL221]|nr:hypothetical protein OIO90_002804 [Microbotryomycetes sp. JL221]
MLSMSRTRAHGVIYELKQAKRFASTTTTTTTTTTPQHKHKIVIVGAGTGGTTVSAQLLRAFKSEGRPLNKHDIAIVDPAQRHHYQPGWTLVGSGLQPLSKMSKPTNQVIPQGVKLYSLGVASFKPDQNEITTTDGTTLSYDYLVVAPGLSTNFDQIQGLTEALKDSSSGVSSIYSLQSVEKAWNDIKSFKGGKAIFTAPAGPVKCAGAPLKIMWMALSQWKKDGIRSSVDPSFATGNPVIFAVPKYAAALEKLRKERNVEGLYNHNLVKVDGKNKIATFKTNDGKLVEEKFDLLHVTPPQGPLEFVKQSPLADATGWISVNQSTTQHTKFSNIFSLGDASSMPNSKTAAAISAQAPVLVDNLRAHLDGEKTLPAKYDGYASCPLLTGHNELMLAEFKYGGVPKETFARFVGSQDKPNAFFYWLKKDFFPQAYWSAFLKGIWFGPKTFFRPIAYMKQ